MDTLKERTALEDMYRRGVSPWALWRAPRERAGGGGQTTVVLDAAPALPGASVPCPRS
jgi:glucose-1-phosphate cytidylyltransferase